MVLNFLREEKQENIVLKMSLYIRLIFMFNPKVKDAEVSSDSKSMYFLDIFKFFQIQIKYDQQNVSMYFLMLF